jgi:hypothetical protein
LRTKLRVLEHDHRVALLSHRRDGFAIVMFASGTVGMYRFAHVHSQAPLVWRELALHPRFTADDVDAIRREGGAVAVPGELISANAPELESMCPLWEAGLASLELPRTAAAR